MEFFNDLILKIKNNYFLLLICLLFIVINDALIISDLYSLKTSTINNVNKNETLKIENENKQSFKVDVKGEVKKPGVYVVDSSMNVQDAINLAGGLKKTASTNNINLSKRLKEEMVIIVSKKTKASSSKTASSTIENNNETSTEILNDAKISSNDLVGAMNETANNAENNNEKLVNINTASFDELTTLSGIGKSKAEAIIEYRENILFEKIEDILNVPGIGESLFEKFKDKITV